MSAVTPQDFLATYVISQYFRKKEQSKELFVVILRAVQLKMKEMP